MLVKSDYSFHAFFHNYERIRKERFFKINFWQLPRGNLKTFISPLIPNRFPNFFAVSRRISSTLISRRSGISQRYDTLTYIKYPLFPNISRTRNISIIMNISSKPTECIWSRRTIGFHPRPLTAFLLFSFFVKQIIVFRAIVNGRAHYNINIKLFFPSPDNGRPPRSVAATNMLHSSTINCITIMCALTCWWQVDLDRKPRHATPRNGLANCAHPI